MIYPTCLNGPMMMADNGALRALALSCLNVSGVTAEQAIEARMGRVSAIHGEIGITEKCALVAGGYVQNGVAVLPLTGTLYRQANYLNEIFAYYLGDTIMEYFCVAFDAAMADENIKAVLVRVDTPGGDAVGCNGVSDKIFQARGTKPIIAHVEGFNCSAGYYDSSACDKIYSTPDSAHGSIGTVVSFFNYDKMLKQMGIEEIEIISSVSPDKRPDETTKDGRALYQQRVDALGDQFVEAVARNRNVSVQTVLSNYGKGWILTGDDALNAGMIDGYATFDEVLTSLAQGKEITPRSASKPQSKIIKTLSGVKTMSFLNFGKQKVAVMQDGQKVGEAEYELVPMTAEASGAAAAATNGAGLTIPVVPALAAPAQGSNPQITALREKVAATFAATHCVKAVAGEQDAYKAKLTALHVKAQESGFDAELEACFAMATGKAEATTNFGAALDTAEVEGANIVGAQAPANNGEPTPERLAQLMALSPLGMQVLARTFSK